MNKCIAATLLLLIAISMTPPFASAGGIGTIEIVITDPADPSGTPITAADVGGIIKVSVYLYGFEALSAVQPSLHFNPDIVQVWRKDGDSFTPFDDLHIFGIAPFEPGGAISGAAAAKWGTAVAQNGFPYVKNATGVIGFWAESTTNKDLIDRRCIYSVYMKAVDKGNPDIRLTRKSDGSGKPGGGYDYYDRFVYSGETPKYAFYYPSGTEVTDVKEVFPAVKILPKELIADMAVSVGQNTATVTATAFNNSEESANVTLYIALYGKENKLLELKTVSDTIAAGEKKDINTPCISLPPIQTGCYIKGFLWKRGTTEPIIEPTRHEL